MAKIINFQAAKKENRSPEKFDDLNTLIRRASTVCKEKVEKSGVVKEGQLKKLFEIRINREIFEREIIRSDIFLCGIYAADLLANLANNIPESWWAMDYNDPNDPLILKKGGDVCFAICGVFPERGGYRLMDIEYYQKMGAGFYYRFYGITKKEIGYHMSCQFEVMTEVVRSCIHNL